MMIEWPNNCAKGWRLLAKQDASYQGLKPTAVIINYELVANNIPLDRRDQSDHPRPAGGPSVGQNWM